MGCARAHSLILVIKSALLIRIFARFTILFDAYSICRHRMCKHRFAPSSDCLVPFSIYKSYMHLHFVHVHVFCTCISISYMHSNFDLHCHLPPCTIPPTLMEITAFRLGEIQYFPQFHTARNGFTLKLVEAHRKSIVLG